MAKIAASTDEKIFQLKAFAGLHQNPDGDTKLKFGEAASMRNWKVTRDGNLQRRNGTKTVFTLCEGEPVRGMWTGHVKEKEVFLAACGGKLYSLWNEDTGEYEKTELGDIDCTNDVHFFGFSGIVYMLNGVEYKQWDGESLEDVHGYIPLVNISVAPNNTSRETLEHMNKLTGKRRMWISPDGEGLSFKLPEEDVQSIDYVKELATGNTVDASAYTYDLAAGTVTFNEALPKSVNSHEIGWTMSTDYRAQVESMRYSELYSGSQDTRVFIYGNGTNEAFYSDIDYDGEPRADYFPDMNEIAVGDANTPITGMIRQYSQLICFKTHSAWSISYGLTTLTDESVVAAFYSTPTNRIIGHEVPGQVALVLNAPFTLHGKDVFEWRNTSSYSSNLSVDERQAKRISDRVYATLAEFDLARCKCYDDNYSQEYYICVDGRALIYGYAIDAWYVYTGFDAVCFANKDEKLFFGSSDGKIKFLDDNSETDDGELIDAYWESGSMSFGQDYMRKYAATLWIGIKPANRANLSVTVLTDRDNTYAEKLISANLSSFADANFGKWSFLVNRRPDITRLKIKAKKFVYYKLILKNDTLDTTATVTAASIKVRYTGYAK